ncbi:thioesterase domain-containing protein [Prosthecobacter fusiformis]|uniref:Thioesterase domain-containing protein n=1 Tax=Prosthecobacter fusiformis TaxID=48464 RepID=A0A4R7SSE1_9BACT|nr:thioesterase domain-containing protein [Prosthecobacter fusiformis]TDU81127.1 thioesterase domain-containing protein [Prosthecobacter fusiformis]
MSAAFLHETELFLHQQIPLTHAMGVRVESYDEKQLVLTAPLEPNHNHLGTAFGGSLSALATLAGYSLLWLLLGDRSAHIVIRESAIRYRHPVTRTLRAICHHPDPAALSAFRTIFEETGKARLTLQVTIEEDERTCVEFTGEFVALK